MSIPPDPSDPAAAILDAAARLAALRPWYDISLAQIAAEAGVSLGEVSRHYPARLCLLAALLRRIDSTALALPTEAGEPPRDRLFEALMQRFDALAPYRLALGAAARELRSLSPRAPRLEALPTSLLALSHLPLAMRWTLEAANIPARGIAGIVRVKLLGLAYASVLPVWLEDDSPDLAATMAALDRALRRIEPLLRLPQTPEPQAA